MTGPYDDPTPYQDWPLSRFLFEASQLNVPEWVWQKAQELEERIDRLEKVRSSAQRYTDARPKFGQRHTAYLHMREALQECGYRGEEPRWGTES